MPQNTGDGLATSPRDVYAQSECYCALCNNCYTYNHNRNRVLLYYLFQENKSFGSKAPFAFILWCTGSCVEHRYDPARFGFGNWLCSQGAHPKLPKCVIFLYVVHYSVAGRSQGPAVSVCSTDMNTAWEDATSEHVIRSVNEIWCVFILLLLSGVETNAV